MKILLTGKPGVGKSTVLEKVIVGLKCEKYGIVSKEIRDDKGQRVGFKAIAMDSREKIFAHKTFVKSKFIVGGKYHVDVEAIDGFVVPELETGIGKERSLIIIDEIGRMQFYSDKFLETARKIFEGEINLLATIVFDDEPKSREFKNHPDVILIEVTKENRAELPGALISAFSNAESYRGLSKERKKFVNGRFKRFISRNEFIQAKKLFNNALIYIAQGRIKKISETDGAIEYSTKGKSAEHSTAFQKESEEYKCDCDLFNGRGEYEGKAGICSHVMAAEMYDM